MNPPSQKLPAAEYTLDRLWAAFLRRLRAVPNHMSWFLGLGGSRIWIRRLRALRDLHEGQRCFIMGNGPSLASMDLSLLRSEYTYGLNRIFLHFERMGFEPTYYVCMNEMVLDQSAREISQLSMPRFLNWSRRHLFPDREGIHFLRESYRRHFSRNITRGIWGGATVTYAALQVAYYMGFQEVILIGVDHRYQARGTPHSVVVSSGDERSHFTPNYFPAGFRWQLPDLRTAEMAYQMAREAFEGAGRIVRDATVGGALEIFPKVEYETLVGKPGG